VGDEKENKSSVNSIEGAKGSENVVLKNKKVVAKG
jgi:hypothetical protein